MNKAVRVTLYISSIILILVIAFFAVKKAGNERKDRNEIDKATEKETIEQSIDTEKTEQDVNDIDSEENNSTEVTQPSVTSEQEEETKNEGTTIVFTGDMLIGNGVSGNYSAKGIDGVLSKDMQEVLKGADITMVNEEFPFGTTGTAMEDKQYTFRVDPSYVSLFTNVGVDIVSLANNHILDFGPDALNQTFSTLDQAGILYAGAGASKERAKALQIIEVGGKKYGFLAASRVIPVSSWNIDESQPGVLATYDATALLGAIKEAQGQCDYLSVFVHWGLEHKEYPEDYERTLAAQYIQAGADAVIGSHSHCLQGVEYIYGKPVFYSLGNFLFGQNGNTAAVKITIDESNQVQYAFIAAKESGACTGLVKGEEAESIYSYLNGISYNANVDKNGIVTEK